LRKELMPLDHEPSDLFVARIDRQRAHDL
jgi:hypothetical protein